MSGGNIDCYMDCASFYSYFALTHLLKQRDTLATHDVTVEFHPIFLGGVNVGSGNKPPWTLPAKGAYSKFDTIRAQKYHGVPRRLEPPSFFPAVTLLPQRALCYIKENFSRETFEQAWFVIFHALWIPPQSNIAEPEAFRQAMQASKLFSEIEVEAILAAATQQEWKDKLLANTKKVLDQGAFGAPWLWVRNAEGKEEPFFGSDRFHFIWEFLGLPWKDIELLPRQAKL